MHSVHASITHHHAALAAWASTNLTKLGLLATSTSSSTTDAPTISTDKQNDPGPATPTPHTESTETDKLLAPMTTHDATVLDSNKLLTQEQQPDPPSGGLMASAQSHPPSATTSFEAKAERYAPTSQGASTLAESKISSDTLSPLLLSY